MIDIDDRCRVLAAHGWDVTVDHQTWARTQAGLVALGSWRAIAEKDGTRLSNVGDTPSRAVEAMFWMVAAIVPGIEADLESL